MGIKYWLQQRPTEKNWGDSIDDVNRVFHETHRYITDRPVTITIQRGYGTASQTTLDPQTVRIENTRIQPDVNAGAAAREPRANAILIGYKGHPTIEDTDVLPGDRFTAASQRFEVRLIWPDTRGKIEAWLEILE